MKKAALKKRKKKNTFEEAENLSFTEVEVEELYSSEVEIDNICEGDFDERNVISRVMCFKFNVFEKRKVVNCPQSSMSPVL